MWLQHERFCDMIKQWWQGYVVNGSPDFVLSQKLKLLKKDLAIWNRESYAKVEEISWRQKSRCLWLKEGDRNTKYFQKVANSHRRYNCIDRLQVGEDIIEEKEQIKRVILDFYQALYSENETWRPSCTFEGLGCLNNEEKDALEVAFEEEEVLDAINSCAPDKSPGPNNFTLAFYQRCWDTVKLDVMGTLNHFHKNCHMVKSFNASFIALIPKRKGAIELKDFRPISLTSNVYKIVAKVLTERLKKVIGKLVSDYQNAFIKGRQITDAALIANEVLDWRQKNGEPGVLFKLDIEKAFDKINWQYLISILRQMGFGEKWIRWIRYTFSTVKYSVLVNRSPVGFFSPKRGIRQGDPLSPFLFILAMEGLSRMLEKAKQMPWMQRFDVGNISGLTVSVSHLLFADDTLIFCGAKKSQVEYLKLTLLIFEALSGLHINMSKSVIYPVNVVPELEMLADIMCCTTSSFYHLLRPPIGLTLINSVLDSIPTYFMSLFPIPVKVQKQLDKLRCSFLWEGNSKNHKFHLVKWVKVTLPKSLGGLEGIRKLWDVFTFHSTLQVGNGEHILFWKDTWLGHTTLVDAYPRLFSIATNPDSTVAQNWEVNSWNPSLRRNLNDWEFDDFVTLLGSLHTSSTITLGRDKLRWGSSRSGAYSIRASFQALSSRKEMIDQWPWKLIWRTKMPPKISVFCWITLNGACLTHDNLIRRGFQLASRCYMCQSNSETINHLFLHCPVATDIWSMFLSLFGLRWTMPCSVTEVFKGIKDALMASQLLDTYSRLDVWSLFLVGLNSPLFLSGIRLTGLQANLGKSSVYFGGVKQDVKVHILTHLGFESGSLPFKYLGIPLSTKKIALIQWQPLIEKITSKMSFWTTKKLSYVGRVQLVQSVIFGIQAYWLNCLSYLLRPKVIFTMWLLLHGRLLTKDRLASWGITITPQCIMFQDQDESKEHPFVKCPYTKELWKKAMTW
ncbi:uncharacterized protein LOC142176070 [Nicotiana tabacum]|uniref:Uncharacterized protein LOC142176070 n=1 Tax=Nicotiana tabacum TaxID=4097 RepID=A0AC58TPS4_TOBAC